MKNMISISLVIMFAYLLQHSSCISKSEKHKEDVLAEEFNFENTNAVPKGAISYGLASNAAYTLPTELEQHYVSPTTVNQLPNPELKEPVEQGPLESIEEQPTEADYYDGSNKLNTVHVDCVIYANPNECFQQSSCGWCGSNNKCVLGNNMGPLQACNKSSYIFNTPVPNWNNTTQASEDTNGSFRVDNNKKETKNLKKPSDNKN